MSNNLGQKTKNTIRIHLKGTIMKKLNMKFCRILLKQYLEGNLFLSIYI